MYFFELGQYITFRSRAVKLLTEISSKDELALLFTGKPAPSSVKNALSEVKVEEEGADGETTPTEPVTRAQSPGFSPQPHATDSTSVVDVDGASISETSGVLQTTQSVVHPILHDVLKNGPGPLHPLFSMEQLGVDRRLIVNRKRLLKMYRVWMQGKFRKLEHSQ